MPQNPACPECGSIMVLRTARRGRNTGNQFYGCSNYPRCREIVSIHDDNETHIGENAIHNQVNTVSFFPHHMSARSKYKNFQSRFIESVATSLDVLESLRGDSEKTDNEIRAFAQWRIDFPIIDNPKMHDERGTQIISVCEKLLTRGKITLCSPNIESRLMELFGYSSFNDNENIDLNIICQEQLVGENYWFDSKAEEIFYYKILPIVFDDDFVQWVTPQVEMSALLPNIEGSNISGRVDFLIYHPSMDKPIVVEIQGAQHRDTHEIDRNRFTLLKRYGYIVEEFTAQDVDINKSRIIEKLKSRLGDYESSQKINDNRHIKLAMAAKMIHQIQIAVIQALKYGFLTITEKCYWGIQVNFEPTNCLNIDELENICIIALEDLSEFLSHMCSLYSLLTTINIELLDINNKNSQCIDSIAININSKYDTDLPSFFIQNVYLPFQVANESTKTNIAILDEPEEEDLLYFLKYLFRKDEFWEGQLDAVLRALSCKDAIVLLPTGGGKSIAFQLASLLLPGRTLVIEPIISLIEDQVDNLASYGIDRCISITSLIVDPNERATVLNLFSQGEYLLLYIAPERLQMTGFREALRSLTTHNPINMVVIDEAHCVSEWGHDFRTSYLNIGRISRDYCEIEGIVPPLLALTGTASRAVLKDVQRELKIEDFDAIITPKSFDRKELKFGIIPCKSSEKFSRLKGYLSGSLPGMFNITRSTLTQTNGKRTFSGLVFCPWVNGEYGVVQVSKQIFDEIAIPNDFYSGKAPKYQGNRHGWNKRKQFVTKSFKNNKMPLLTCTKAFGMGIDKPNIRYTIHYSLPSSIEAFYQEAGRAGRDRNIAFCTILASLDDKERATNLLNPNTSVEEIAKIIDETPRVDNDDITRVLFFHAQAFKGVEAELSYIDKMLTKGLSEYNVKGEETVCYERDDRSSEEKSLHRLLLLGIIDDYTIDYTSNAFTVHKTGASKEDIINAYESYIAGYLGSRSRKEVEKAYKLVSLDYDSFVIEMLKLLLQFIYNVIEQGRRRALLEMFLLSSDQANDSTIRQRILNYLEETEHSVLIEELLEADDAGIDKVSMIIEEIWSPNEASEIRGQASRYLESYPDYPSLLMLRSITEIFTKDKDLEVVKQNFFASIRSAVQNYDIDKNKLYLFIAKALSLVEKQNKGLANKMLEKLMGEFEGMEFAKIMVKELPEDLAVAPALQLLLNLNQRCIQTLIK